MKKYKQVKGLVYNFYLLLNLILGTLDKSPSKERKVINELFLEPPRDKFNDFSLKKELFGVRSNIDDGICFSGFSSLLFYSILFLSDKTSFTIKEALEFCLLNIFLCNAFLSLIFKFVKFN